MPTSPLNRAVQHLLADLRPDGGGPTDGELLARFLSSRDEEPLAALVRRHAPMVWALCRRLLVSHHDAEDAFQATFLVLVRRAADVPGQAVANWLFGVARQTAVRLRALAARRGRRETQVAPMPEPTVAEVRDADWQAVLDEELGRLPDHYRGVLVLCDLEGMTRKEAARQLGIPEGSVASRLARARALLAKRLSRRGLVFSGGSVAAVLSAESAVASAPPALVASTIRAASLLAAGRAAGVVPARVAALTEGMVQAMFVTRIRSVLAVVLVAAALAGAAGLLSQTRAADQPKAKQETPAARKDPKKGEKAPTRPLLTLYGRNSKITAKKVLRITSEKEWQALWMAHKTGSPDPKAPPGDLEHAELDFGKVMALAVFEGVAANCAGYTAHSIREDRERITVRLRAHQYGSVGETPATQAWGILILPRSGKEIVVERDVRTEKRGAPVWKEWKKFPPLPKPKGP